MQMKGRGYMTQVLIGFCYSRGRGGQSLNLRRDYFGILMEAKVTCFPFNVLDNPMYCGSTAIYLGWALM
ncbi:UNVERIFIED_CONTAM: hypothetical protein K2H54_020272 [Gekko kuhli]